MITGSEQHFVGNLEPACLLEVQLEQSCGYGTMSWSKISRDIWVHHEIPDPPGRGLFFFGKVTI